jgi:hypothetical protein
VVAGFSYSIRLGNIGVAFFTLFLGLYLLVCRTWISNEINRSFFDPRCRWFEGLPRPVPWVSCEIPGRGVYQVSNVDEDGVFLFSRSPAAGPLGSLGGSSVEFALRYRGRSASCRGRVVTLLGSGAGGGVEFEGMRPDELKDLSDFVELMRGEGHVA